MKPPQFTVEQVAVALKATMGKVYLAAKELGCSHQTVYNYLNNNPELKELVEAERGQMIDVAECALKRATIKGEAWAVCFTLKTIGKDRGYIERHQQELSGRDGKPVAFKAADLTDDQLAAIVGGQNGEASNP